MYDQNCYAIIQALKKWRHYVLPKEFLLYTYHQAIQYLNNQSKLNQRHMRGRILVELHHCVEA